MGNDALKTQLETLLNRALEHSASAHEMESAVREALARLSDSEGWVDCGKYEVEATPQGKTVTWQWADPAGAAGKHGPGTYRVMLRKVEEQSDG